VHAAAAEAARPATLRVEGLTVSYGDGATARTVLRDVDLVIEAGQAHGLVGESGSGKSTLALAVMRHLSGAGRVDAGRILLGGDDLLALDGAAMRRVWRSRIKLVPQDPLASLDPRMRVGEQIAESLGGGARARRERVRELLGRVGLADPERVGRSFPHQLSGGMQQRVMIALALAGEPELLIMDEPTTNLDVTTEATILDLVRDLIDSRATALLYVSHSLGVVAQLCDRVAVLYAGEVVEDAPVTDLFASPLHPYTRALLDSVPTVGRDRRSEPLRGIGGSFPGPDERPGGCIFAPRCPVATDLTRECRPALEAAGGGRRVRCHRWREIAEGTLDARQPEAALVAVGDRAGDDAELVLEVEGLEKRFPLRRGPIDVLRGRPPAQVHAVAGVDLGVRRSATLGLIGESGSGKSTLARCVVGLLGRSGGSVRLVGDALEPSLARRDTSALRRLQMVFQNADEALNPQRRVGEILRRPLERLAGVPPAQVRERIAWLLRAVRLQPEHAERFPAELSGGERQRVAIARAFASGPDLLVFDESLSGLDVSVQASVLGMLEELQAERRSAYLFISHDLAVVGYLADEIAVIYLGRLMESGTAAAVLEPPYHPYTETLLSAVPVPDPLVRRDRIRLRGEAPSPVDPPTGCPFHTRCPRFLGDVCVEREPPWREDERGKGVSCHIPLAELARLQVARGAAGAAAVDRHA
jgi:peptide/nickel transport system ATP-binding protein